MRIRLTTFQSRGETSYLSGMSPELVLEFDGRPIAFKFLSVQPLIGAKSCSHANVSSANIIKIHLFIIIQRSKQKKHQFLHFLLV